MKIKKSVYSFIGILLYIAMMSVALCGCNQDSAYDNYSLQTEVAAEENTVTSVTLESDAQIREDSERVEDENTETVVNDVSFKGLKIGMSVDEVWSRLGEPEDTKYMNNSDGTFTIWMKYKDDDGKTVLVIVENKKVLNILKD